MPPHASNPDPLTRFEEEHQRALGQLDRLEAAAGALETGEDPAEPLGVMREVHGFLSTAVREHNENEEHVLFPLLGENVPVEVFCDEHVRLRALEQELDQALGTPDPVDVAPELARELSALLRAHIEREDTVLFPMARGILGPAGLARVRGRLAGR